MDIEQLKYHAEMFLEWFYKACDEADTDQQKIDYEVYAFTHVFQMIEIINEKPKNKEIECQKEN